MSLSAPLSLGVCVLDAKVRPCFENWLRSRHLAAPERLAQLSLPAPLFDVAPSFCPPACERSAGRSAEAAVWIRRRHVQYHHTGVRTPIVAACAFLAAVRVTSAFRDPRRDSVLLGQPAVEWPRLDCLLFVYSPGFPVTKVEEYVRLRKPYCLNNVSAEHVLRDRRLVYHVLLRHGIPVARHAFMIRAGPVESHSVLEELEDAVVVDGVTIHKPFVEKPVDANVGTPLFACVRVLCE